MRLPDAAAGVLQRDWIPACARITGERNFFTGRFAGYGQALQDGITSAFA
jgi:hypothetical protein